MMRFYSLDVYVCASRTEGMPTLAQGGRLRPAGGHDARRYPKLRDRLGRATRVESWNWRWQAARYDAMRQ